MPLSNLSASAARGVTAVDQSENDQGATAPRSALQNRTALSKSPFIRGGEHSQVKWQVLDGDSINRAKQENKLIFLHIGYKGCHTCYLMAKETFSNPECAAILNESFVPVIVDRDERPDIDATYMNYVQAISNNGGWPLNVFVTPDLAPVFGRTYCPGPEAARRKGGVWQPEPLDTYTIFRRVRDIWSEQETRCRKEAAEVVGKLREFAAEGALGIRELSGLHPIAKPSWAVSTAQTAPLERQIEHKKSQVSSELDLDQLEEAYSYIVRTWDPINGGFGFAPKFPIPPKLAFLIYLNTAPSVVQDVVGHNDCRYALKMALTTLRRIRDGALHDHIGGTGFFRCSVTSDWSVPSFEKLVVDNALLLALYLDAWQVSGGKADSEFYDTVIEIADYLSSAPIVLTEGGLASSEAADSMSRRSDNEMTEGAYYLWTRGEFDSVVDASTGNRQASRIAAAYWDVRERGNIEEDYDPNDEFMKRNIPRVVRTPEDLSKQFELPIDEIRQHIEAARQGLKTRREKDRLRPSLDDKVITAFNAVAISALARAAIAVKGVDQLRSQKYIKTATAATAFIKAQLWDNDAKILYRLWRDGRNTPGFADDYAYLINGLLDLYRATGDESYVEFADILQRIQNTFFLDIQTGGFFTTCNTLSDFNILRLKEGMDTSLPSINAASAKNLLRLAHLLDDEFYLNMAKETLNAFEPDMLQHSWLFPGLLSALVLARLGINEPVSQLRYKSERLVV